jgi:ubiquitin carboxyl-terminal hydrolase 16/45
MAEVPGLKNLGNTCYFNASLQNLSATPLLRGALNDPEGGTLSQALVKMLGLMGEAEGSNKVLNPNELLGRIRQKAPQFKGWRQQDAHELILNVVGRLDDEQIDERKKRKAEAQAETEAASADDDGEKEKKSESTTPPEPTPVMGTVFSGRLCSTVVCKDCSTVSRSWEPFVDVSLELPAEPKAQKKKGGRKGSDEKRDKDKPWKKNKKVGEEEEETEASPTKASPSKAKGKGKTGEGKSGTKLDLREIKKMSPKEMKKHLKERGLSTQGQKKELIQRLMTSELERGAVPKVGKGKEK